MCNLCGDIIESKFRHNFVECSCKACFVDGGHDYQRIGYAEEGCFTNLSEYEEVPFRYKDEELNKCTVLSISFPLYELWPP